MSTPARIVIVSPALADANNGNWQTARRWQELLAPHEVRIVKDWPDPASRKAKARPDDVMLALHARRSAGSIAAWAARPAGSQGLVVVLTGTDLYRDIQADENARHSLALAAQLVVLQERGPNDLPAVLRGKTRVIFQSGTALPPASKPPLGTQLRAVMVGHLREEKSPQTLFEAAQLLAGEAGIFIDHIGEPLDVALGEQARATAAACPHYRWLGGQPHAATRRHIQRAHVLVHTSRMEGGAHVVMEAVLSATPVLASRIPGNVGMLGQDYAGYFEPGNAQALADVLKRCRQDAGWLAQLQTQCALLASLFAPEAEAAALHQLVQDLRA